MRALLPFLRIAWLPVALALLAACGRDEAAPPPAAAPTAPAPTPPAAAPEPEAARPPAPPEPGIVRELTQDGREMVTERGRDIPLPASFPRDVPPFPGASATMVRTVGDDSVMALFEATAPAEEVIGFYREELEREGWKIQGEAEIPQRKMLMAMKGARRVSLLVTPDEVTKYTLIVGIQR